MTDAQKDKAIHNSYYDTESGFKSAYATYQEVRFKFNGITLSYVKNWFERNVERTSLEGKGKNSFVAPHPKYEYQVDLFEITDNQFADQAYKYGLSCIDIFTKFATVIPMKTKSQTEILESFKKVLEQMGKPKILYTDDEAGMAKNFNKYLDEQNIVHIVTKTHAHFVERFHRTFRGMLHKRLAYLLTYDPDKLNKIKKNSKGREVTTYRWDVLVPSILKAYNNTKHSATNHKPSEAGRDDVQADVKASMELKARSSRKYPEIKVGDLVRVIRKKKLGEKEYTGTFKPKINKVIKLENVDGNTLYHVEGENKPLIRADIVIHKQETPIFRNIRRE
jgi:hypothetical protein